MSGTADLARDYGSSMADRAAGAYRRTGYAARDAADTAGSFAREHPLAIGIAIAAMGAAIAAFLPRTRREDELLGEKSDAFKAAAREQAEVQVERAREAASAVVETAKKEARDAGLTPEGMKQKLGETVNAATGVAKAAAEAGASKVKDAEAKPAGSSPTDELKTGKPGASAGSETEPVRPAIGEPTPTAPTGGVAGVSGIPTPPTQAGSFGSTMDSRPVSPPEAGKVQSRTDGK